MTLTSLSRSQSSSTGTPAPPRRRPRWSARVQETLAAYVFLAPTLLLLGLFVFVPLVSAFVLSFQKTNGFGAGVFVGVANYVRLLSDGQFWRAALNTSLFTLVVVPASMLIGFGLAVLMNSVLPARKLFRTIIVLPMSISGVATALIGVLVFEQTNGIANKVLVALGAGRVSWQSNGPAAFVSVVLVTLWWRIGFNMIIYLAGLQGISPELYEAAEIEGATRWQQLRYITWPMVAPATFFLLTVNVIYSFQVFDIVFVLTQGGPGNATNVLVTYAYNNGFLIRDQGYAAAIGMFLLVTILIVTAVQWRLNRGRDVIE